MVFHWRLNDSESPQGFWTLLSSLAVLNAVIWMVSTRLPTSKSFSPFSNPLVTVPKAPITIGTVITLMFHSFFNSLARSRHLFFSHSFSFILWSARTAKSTIFQILSLFLLLLIVIRFGLLAEIRWSVCMSKSYRSLCVSFSRTGDFYFCVSIWHHNGSDDFFWLALREEKLLQFSSVNRVKDIDKVNK